MFTPTAASRPKNSTRPMPAAGLDATSIEAVFAEP